jgi:hypothetical protein
MEILIHPLSSSILKKEYPDGIIHESDIILDVMFSNFNRRSINRFATYTFQTTRKINPALLRPENLYYYHKKRIFEAVLEAKNNNQAAWPYMQALLDSYAIDDDIYDIASLYREFTRYIQSLKTTKKAVKPMICIQKKEIFITEDEMAVIVADNIDFFYHHSGFDHAKYKMLEAYFHKKTTYNVSRPERTIRHQSLTFKNYLITNKKLSNSVFAVLQ